MFRHFSRTTWFLIVVVVLFTAPIVRSQDAAPAPAAVAPAVAAEEPMASFEKMADKALEGYNAQDWKAFYADYASTMAGIATEQAFQTMYTNMYFKEYGKYTSRTVIKERCSISPDSPVALVVYAGVFEKNPKVVISINFTKDGDAWKVMQIQFNKE